MDPDLPRFINQDSYLGKIITPPSLNRYTYAYANPTVYFDPNGHIAWMANLRDNLNNWSSERLEASAGLNNVSSYSWLNKGMAGAAGIGAGMADLAAVGVSTVNYAANQASRGLNKLGLVSDETAARHAAEVAGTHKSLGQAYDAVSTEEGRSRIVTGASNTLSAAMSGDTGAIAKTSSIFAPVPGAAVVGATAKIGKVAVNSIKSSKTVINAVEKAKTMAGQAISITVESAQNTIQKVKHGVKKIANKKVLQNFGRGTSKNTVNQSNIKIEAKVLMAQGLSRKEAFNQIRLFNAGHAGDYSFHFTNKQAGKAIIKSKGLLATKQGLGGPGLYTGTTPTPNILQKYFSPLGWGVNPGSNVRIPIRMVPELQKIARKPILPRWTNIIGEGESILLRPPQ